MNHKLLGRNWAEMHADRIFAFYSLEKAVANPHYHALIRFFSDDSWEVSRQAEIFDRNAAREWRGLVPGGTLDVQAITEQRGVANYINKTAQYELYYENFIVPDEFRRG